MASLRKFFTDIVNQWLEDEPFSLAAALSYYTLFSLAPLLIIAIAVAGFFFGRDAAQNQVVETLQGLVGQESAQAVQAIVEKAAERPNAGAFSTGFGIVMLLFGAGGVVGQLQFVGLVVGERVVERAHGVFARRTGRPRHPRPDHGCCGLADLYHRAFRDDL
jgi:uncharacterized BrkB/YihY/UPF0761 family membrane protein